ncbi:hypothetical protein N7526_000065 [Penicillium atrosanguineum]|nr:hypothetical protein N7526_000065 [Penicillium atrosanguineum]
MNHSFVPERFTVKINKRKSTARETYPRTVRELGKTEVRMLTNILHLDNTGSSSHLASLIEQLIHSMPKRLRRAQPLSSSRVRSAGLCGVHKGLNSELINDILTRVQHEVTSGLRQIEEYLELIGDVEAEILAKLRTLQGMWTKPQMGKPVAPNALPYQINGCAACILARIAADSEMIRNLRVVLQSRTRTRKNHRAPTLLVFVDECIRHFGGDKADELFGIASNLAFQMKATRKACIKAWLIDNKDSRRHQRKLRSGRRRDRRSDGSTDRSPYIPPDRASYSRRTSDSPNTHESAMSRRSTTLTPVTSQSSLTSHRQSLYLHPKSIASTSLHVAPFGANSSTTSIHSWSEVERELSMIRTCREIATDNPYSRATPVPGARVEPLRVSRVDSRHEQLSMSMSMRNSPTYKPYVNENSSFLNYSSSDYWTDATLDSEEENLASTFKSQPPPQPQPRDPVLQGQPRVMTTWGMMVDQSNMI